MTTRLVASADTPLPLWITTQGGDLPDALSPAQCAWAEASGFSGKAGQVCLLPDTDGTVTGALFGIGAHNPDRRRDRFILARAAEALPKNSVWVLRNLPQTIDPDIAALSWLLGGYHFGRYKDGKAGSAALVTPEGVDARHIEALAKGEFLTRDLINTPANDMGPDDLEQAAMDLAQKLGGTADICAGGDLIDQNLPLIHAVGRAGAQPPRLIDLRFGDTGPQVTLVGKGVCFDTGGLNLKPGSSMGLMKKDMGGAATVLGLTSMLVETGAAKGIRLRVLIPAVENAVAGNAFRPGDILTSRKGLTVEINNTDAEGRLVLADALALAAEDNPDLLISMATLTGAARVALGPDLPPFYCDDDDAATALFAAGRDTADPIWRMPFWEAYETMIEPGIADLDNAPSGGFAGSVTAALFLRRFTEGAKRYAHFDIYGWQPGAAPGRPKGGVGQGARAILAALPKLLS